MRTLAAALALATLPFAPAQAADPLTTTWVAERITSKTAPLRMFGGAGADDHDYALAAVVSATVSNGQFTQAEGALFFGIAAESSVVVRTPAGETRCDKLPSVGTACSGTAGAGMVFGVWWDAPEFNRALIVMRGRSTTVALDDSPGWRLRRWTGPVRIVTGDAVNGEAPFGTGASAWTRSASTGGPAGSVAIGHPPCRSVGYTNAGAEAARLLGGAEEVVATCALPYPPASYANGSAAWDFTGAAAGLSDVPARLVVIERPAR